MAKTHSHYQDYRNLRGDGRIVLYKRGDHQNPKWTVRLKIPRIAGFVVKSSKTTDEFEARRFAEDLYYELEGRARRGEPIRSPAFREVFSQWARSFLTGRQDRTEKYINGNVRRLAIWALPHFADRRIDLTTEDALVEYFEWRLSQPKRPALSTLRNERTALNQLFRFAKRKGYIREVPQVRISSSKQTARPDIPEVEWLKLTSYLDEYVAAALDRRRRRERFYLKQYILLLGNTGIRVGEARRLRWCDVSSTRTLTGEHRTVLTVRGKTGEREVVCNVGMDEVLHELMTIRSRELGSAPNGHELIFCHRDGRAIGSFKKGFERVVREAGVLHSSDGKRRVPYSLRHTYATMRISEGVSVFQLAANMGTSVEMIEEFYGKKRVRDPKVATELTKASGGSRTAPEAVQKGAHEFSA